jgi:hypothetical protein
MVTIYNARTNDLFKHLSQVLFGNYIFSLILYLLFILFVRLHPFGSFRIILTEVTVVDASGISGCIVISGLISPPSVSR